MNRFSPKAPVALIALASGVGLVAIAAVVTQQPKLAAEPRKPQFERPAPEAIPARPHKTSHRQPSALAKPQVEEDGVVLAVTLDGDDPKLSRTIPVSKGADARVTALQATMKGLGYDDVRVLSASLKKGTLVIDVSPALQKHGFGSMAESNFIKGIQMTLAQFKDAKSFQFRCDGQIIDTLGHFEMTEPVPVSGDSEASPTP